MDEMARQVRAHAGLGRGLHVLVLVAAVVLYEGHGVFSGSVRFLTCENSGRWLAMVDPGVELFGLS